MSNSRSRPSERQFHGEQENRQLPQMYGKMYLDESTADVFFVCKGVDGAERVPAHKLLLSVGSTEFKSLFASSDSTKLDFEMLDVPAAAFKEFLQFFYVPKIKQTLENLEAVMKLAKDFNCDEALHHCGVFLDQKMTPDNLIWGYAIAIRFGRIKLRHTCEQRISISATNIFKSNSLYECDRDVLSHVLQMDMLKCLESHVLLGCVTWAKTKVAKKALDHTNMRVLRDELGDLLQHIRFRSMTVEEFALFIASYPAFFCTDELEEIIKLIAMKEFKSEKFNNNYRIGTGWSQSQGHSQNQSQGQASASSYGSGNGKNGLLICDRYINSSSRYYPLKVETTNFMVNKEVVLLGFACNAVSSQGSGSPTPKLIPPAKVTVFEAQRPEVLLYEGEYTLTMGHRSYLEFSKPVPLQQHVHYRVVLDFPTRPDCVSNTALKHEVEMKDDLKVRFLDEEGRGFQDSKYGLVSLG